MSRVQIVAVLVTVLLSALDGYDVLSMSFVAPAVSHAWGMNHASLGLVLSCGLVGMAIGSLGLAPLADMAGRLPIVFAAVVVMAAGSLLSAFTHTAAELAWCRVLTGLGIGVQVAVINPLAAEYANQRRRALAVSFMAVGYPIGGVVGGLTTAGLMRAHGWPALFIVGAVAGLLLLPAIAVWLPESPAYLITRQPKKGLQRLNAFLVRCGHPALPTLPNTPPAQRTAYGALFAPGMAAITLRITLVNLLATMAAYYVLSWLPQMVADAGFPPSTASLVSVAASLVGVAAGLSLGALAVFTGPARLAAGSMIGLGVAIAAFGYAPSSLPLLISAAGACGFFLFGSTGVFYATLATTFTAGTRASGSGFVMGVGRVGSAIGPYFAGWMFSSGVSRGAVSLMFAALVAIAGVILLGSKRREQV